MNRTTEYGFMLMFVLVLIMLIGWVMNFFDVAQVAASGNIDAEGALHIIGIFVMPLGAFMGIFF